MAATESTRTTNYWRSAARLAGNADPVSEVERKRGRGGVRREEHSCERDWSEKRRALSPVLLLLLLFVLA
jgi:hypothetical protein